MLQAGAWTLGEKGPNKKKHRVYYESGSIMEKGQYKDDLKQGTWYFYNEQGVVVKKERYREGKLQWQMFMEKGRIVRTIDRNGKVTERPKCGC